MMNYHGGDIYKYNKDILDFSSNINPLGVPERFKEKLKENFDLFTKYPDMGYIELRRSIAEYLELDDIDCMVVGNGAVEIIYRAIEALKMDEVVIMAPTFSEYRRAAQFKGVNFNEVKSYDYRGKLLINKLNSSIKPNSLMVLCNPNNPTGTVTSTEMISQLAKKLEQVNSYLLVDEAFIEFTDNYPNSSMVGKIREHENMIIVRAATKFFGMPGIRLGYGISYDEKLIKDIRERQEPWNINTGAVLAGLTIFYDKDYIYRSREWIEKERAFLYEGLKTIKSLLVCPSQSNFFLIKSLKEDKTSNKLKELMIDKGILIRTNKGFTHLGPYHIRVAVKDRSSNIKLLQGLMECMD